MSECDICGQNPDAVKLIRMDDPVMPTEAQYRCKNCLEGRTNV